MIIYKGIKDILPSKINHLFLDDDGVYGEGFYYSKQFEIAEWYAFKHCEKFGIVVSYEVEELNTITMEEGIHYTESSNVGFINLTEEGKKQLNIHLSEIKTNKLAQHVRDAGFDAFEILYRDYSNNFSNYFILLYEFELVPLNYFYRDMNDILIEYDDIKQVEAIVKKELKSKDW